MSKRLTIMTFAFALLLWAGGANVSAQYPQEYQMGSVESLVWQVGEDAARLLDAVRKDRNSMLGLNPEAQARLQDLRQAVALFERDLKIYARNPIHTGESYKNLEAAYGAALPIIEVMGNRRGTQTPAGRIIDSMRILGGYYAAPPGAAGDDWKLRQAAADIMRITTNVYDHVRIDQIQGRTDPYTAEQFGKLSAAAYRFYAIVRAEHFDSRHLDEAYTDLVDKFRGARDVAGRVNLNVQSDLGTAWGLAQQLNFITPHTRIGEYQIHDFYR